MLGSSRACPGRWPFHLRVPFSNRPWRFGKVKKPMYRRRSKLYFIEPGATGLHGMANILPRWKEHEHDNHFKS
jgi:hypothetical protein